MRSRSAGPEHKDAPRAVKRRPERHPLLEGLSARDEVTRGLPPDRLRARLDSWHYTGMAGAFADRVLAEMQSGE
ncbi:MAG: hypothetical protein ACREH6_14280 [Geminicoccaceae bacterium]